MLCECVAWHGRASKYTMYHRFSIFVSFVFASPRWAVFFFGSFCFPNVFRSFSLCRGVYVTINYNFKLLYTYVGVCGVYTHTNIVLRKNSILHFFALTTCGFFFFCDIWFCKQFLIYPKIYLSTNCCQFFFWKIKIRKKRSGKKCWFFLRGIFRECNYNQRKK